MKLLSGNANQPLAEKIAAHLKQPLSQMTTGTFSDGEISVSIGETVRGCDVFIIQPTCHPVNNSLMELLIIADACRRASVGRITAVIPYFGYARQDRKVKPRDPISAKLVADLITTAGVDRVLTMDLHAPQVQGFFSVPVDNLLGSNVLAAYYESRVDNTVVVSPDFGSVDRVRRFAQRLNLPIAIIDKRRERANQSQVMNIIGDVRGKNVLLMDDLIDTAGTLVNAAEAVLAQGGAIGVRACASHGVLSGQAVERLQNSAISEIVLLDTIPLPAEKRIDKVKQLSVAPLIAKAIELIATEQPVSPLFNL